MGETAVFKWPWPERSQVADAPKALGDYAKAVETTFRAPAMLDFVPRWWAVGAIQPSNPVRTVGKYRVLNGWCDLHIYMEFGPSTGGGTERLQLDVPVAATPAISEQYLLCKTWIPGIASVNGMAQIYGGTNTLAALFPVAPNYSTMGYWQSSDSSGSLGTGVPNIGGGYYPIRSGGNFSVGGRFKVA